MDELGEVDPLTLEIFLSIRRVATFHRRLMHQKLVAEGGHSGAALCLRLLAHHDGMTQRDLAERLHLSRPRITRMLQSLERSGMVVRRTDDRDQRLTRVHLTHEGRSREEELRRVWADYLSRTVGSLSEPDRRELLRLVALIGDRFEALLENGQDEGA